VEFKKLLIYNKVDVELKMSRNELYQLFEQDSDNVVFLTKQDDLNLKTCGTIRLR